MAESKRTKSNPEAARPQNSSVGEMLRAARVAKKMSIEEVSVALRIRAAQLRVIEENNINALPGMTYAIGFVRSYANFVGLDPTEVVHKFKAEYGQETGHSKLTFPEPIAENRMPNPIMMGVGAFLAIVVLVIWTIYSNAHNNANKIAEQIPPAPAVATTSESSTESLLTPAAQPAPEQKATAAAPAAATPSATPATVADAAAAPVPAPAPPAAAVPAPEQKIAAAAPEAPAAAPQPPAGQPASPVAAAVPSPEAAAAVPSAAAEKPAAPEAAAAQADKKNGKEEADAVINIKRGKSRITLKSVQSTWVQITSGKGTVYKKVMKPGEQYYVPDQSGLSLSTANAGGLDVYVDGQRAPSLGGSGQILRGVSLDPSSLKRKQFSLNN